ncbi:hypothetical protein [Amycolatopsis circi]|uniref:hypothetical protein n=1 Tax=Amycolatopsis circi TaxID=871959 RepID=UPI0013BE9988|nr:hypothetical protein [Amycolatopsis circi]
MFFVVACLGMGLLSVAFGLVVGSFGSTATIIVVSVVLAVLAIAGAALVSKRSSPLVRRS